jgi:hypothetical protein
MRHAALFALALLGAVSCSRSEPRIRYGTLRLVYYQEAEGPVERFSFFVVPEDEDGIEDLEELRLYHDREGLAWSLTRADWIEYEAGDKTWIGSRAIAMIDDGVLPRGLFRAVLLDKGGERSDRLFSFDAPETPHPFPSCVISGGNYAVDSEYPDNYFICCDGGGEFLAVLSAPALRGALKDLDLPPDTRGIALWAEDPEYGTAALTDLAAVR